MGMFIKYIKYTHENEIIWSQRRVQANSLEPPLSSGSAAGNAIEYIFSRCKKQTTFSEKNVGEIRVIYVQKKQPLKRS